MPAAARTGVLGGTFDPPHRAHLAFAAAARAHLRLDRVLFVPTGNPWRKRLRRGDLSPARVRLRLVRAALEGLPWAEVDDLELRRGGMTYTADTLDVLTAGGGEWWFLLGTDALADMPAWHAPDRIVELARLAGARRPGAVRARELVTARLRERVPGIDDRVDVVPLAPLSVSSSEIRRRVHDGQSTAGLMPERVRTLVDALGLYRGR